MEIISFEKEKDLIFKTTIEVFPIFDLIEFKTIHLTKEVIKVTDKAMTKILYNIAKEKGLKKEIDPSKFSKIGNIACIDFSGTIDGKKFEGSESKDFEFEIGSGVLLKDFEKHLIKTKSGDSISFKIKFPMEYPKNIAGKEAEFHVVVKKIEEIQI